MARPKDIERWSLTKLREKLIKIGAKLASSGLYVTFEMAEVAVSRGLFCRIPERIDGLRPAPVA